MQSISVHHLCVCVTLSTTSHPFILTSRHLVSIYRSIRQTSIKTEVKNIITIHLIAYIPHTSIFHHLAKLFNTIFLFHHSLSLTHAWHVIVSISVAYRILGTTIGFLHAIKRTISFFSCTLSQQSSVLSMHSA